MKLKEIILQWADSQDWNNAVLRNGATEIEQASISYRFTEFAKYSGDVIDEALEGSKYYRIQQSIVNTEAPILK